MSLFCCDDGLVLDLQSYNFEIRKTTTTGTDFFFKIQETSFVDNVYLVTDGHYIKATHYVRGYFKDEYEKTNCKVYYSIFHARYVYPVPCELMESHWCYSLNWSEEHLTSSMFFKVENYFEHK